MIEFIIDILFNYPEGISFALFGMKKKKKKAEKMMKQFDKGVPELDSLSLDTNSGEVPQFSETQRQTRASQAPTATSYKPVFPYRGKQIIIDSDRVLLNAKDDSVFILGDKAVGISTNGTFNINSGGKTIINSPEINLGLDAKHPIIKGDEFLAIFQQFLLVINQVTVPELEEATDSNDVKIASVNRAGEGLRKATEALSELLPSTLSDTVKTL
jgi:hypothetical protein